MAVNLLSIGGNLEPTYYDPKGGDRRAESYEPIDIGKPIIIRYLRFFVKHEKLQEENNEIMISTHVKTAEEKAAAAEAINYYNPVAPCPQSTFELTDFGACHYGHELCYYTKSYFGESVRLTTRIMELDKPSKKVVDAVKAGLSSVAGLPVFASYLPYAAVATVGVNLVAGFISAFNRDDVILPGHDVDLHFRRNHARRLQSGRFVCISEGKPADFIGKYKLSLDNRLVTDDDAEKEYTASTYYVLQVNCETNRLYEDFDYFQKAAELMEKTNRGGNPMDFVQNVVSSFRAYNDIDAIRQIRMLEGEQTEEAKKLVTAYIKSMSPDVQLMYKDRIVPAPAG